MNGAGERAVPGEETGKLVAGVLVVDPDGYRAWFGDRSLSLSRSQLELLAILVANSHRVVPREEMSAALGLARTRSVDVMLSLLRRELGRDFVRNVRNRGWIIVPEALV